jgi:hypothetical protein
VAAPSRGRPQNGASAIPGLRHPHDVSRALFPRAWSDCLEAEGGALGRLDARYEVAADYPARAEVAHDRTIDRAALQETLRFVRFTLEEADRQAQNLP